MVYKNREKSFSVKQINLMMMMMMIYITFKGDFLSRHYFEMLILFSYISHNQWELIFVTEI